jgi:hypothetical protein
MEDPLRPGRRPAAASAAAAPGDGRRWGAALAAAALALALFGLRGEVRTHVGADDSYYLLQGSSLIEDGDLDLRNDALASGFTLPDRLALLTNTTAAGSLDNEFSIGPALLWAPAYLAGLPLRQTPPEQAAVRWSRSQRDALHLWSLLLLAGLAWFLLRLYRLAAPEATIGEAALPAAALLIGTPLLVYATSVYTMAHLPSAVAAALLIAAALELERTPRAANALLAGVALGLVFLMRWQDLAFAALLAVPLARRPWRRGAALTAWAGLGFLAVASVQLHAWYVERGGWLAVPDPQGAGFLQWARPALAGFLFSGRSGLLSWSPIFALAAVGLLLPWRCRLSRRWAVAALVVLAAEIYLSAARGDWWGGHSFGARRLSSCVPLLPLGLANLWRQFSRTATALLVLCLGWGLFTGQLYWSGVQDLSLVLRGVPSDLGTPAAAERAVVSDPGEARARSAHLSLSPPADYWASAAAARNWPGIAATWLMIAAALGGLTLALARAAPRRLLALALAGALTAALAAHLRLAGGPHPVAAERAAWGRLARQWQAPPRQPEQGVAELAREANGLGGLPGMGGDDPRELLAPSDASGGTGSNDASGRTGSNGLRTSSRRAFGASSAASAPPPVAPSESSPADAYRYVRMFLEWRAGDPARARSLLAALLARGYPAAREASAALREAEQDGEVLRWIPGSFFRPVRGRPAFELPLPPSPPGARLWRRWEIACNLTPGDLVAGELHDLLHLADAGSAPLADLAARGGGGLVLATPRGQEEVAGRGLQSGRRHRLHLRYEILPLEASATLTAPGNGSAVSIAVRAAPEARAPRKIAFGRIRSRRLGAYSLRGSSFSDLWITARP